MLKIRRALISVWDKKGIIDLSRKLTDLNVEIISTGKTASLLQKSGIPARTVSSITAFPEILSGRVKTLHPKIFGGILANKKHPLHMEDIKNLDIPAIDMVVVNLYPFLQKMQDNLSWDQMIEYIDIGGASLLRAGGKNFKNVAVLSSAEQYRSVISELNKNKGFIGEATLKNLAEKAFFVTQDYDRHIYNFFRGKPALSFDLEKAQDLRYGENPHQSAGIYACALNRPVKFNQLQGKELSYNNFLDLDTAYACVRDFDEPACAIVKHASICGVGIGRQLCAAYKNAHAVDPLSSFGGIIALNRKVDKETARAVVKTGFKECVVAPSYSKEALKLFSDKKNLRVIEADFTSPVPAQQVRSTLFGYLIQARDGKVVNKSNLRIVSRKKPTAAQLKDLLLAWKAVKFVKSNAVVLVKGQVVLSLGGGQPSRVGAVKIALERAIKPVSAAVLASDGFFPKDDSIKAVAKKGVKAVIAPSGSIKDQEVIAAADKAKIALVFVDSRHFRH